ncbi:uncharacterized protein [Drosophila suzukii]|uniref:DUF5641 domain-containing protein n=1 Tax=Drosophila suzukii TaxID=28584 RepID=A0ABM4TW01_DROSZ
MKPQAQGVSVANSCATSEFDDVFELLQLEDPAGYSLNIIWKEFESISDQMVLFDEEEGYVDPAIDNERYVDKYLQASTLFRNLIRTCEEAQENEREGNNFRHSGNPDAAAPMASGVGNENLVRFLEQQQQLNERFAEQQAMLLRATSAANVMHNELPKIHIKLFTGDYKEWPAFKNIFESTIHSKQHLTAIQKLHYLKTYITGEAADLIRHMPITDAAYEAAWTCLIDRYNRQRHIVNTLLETFINLPSTARADVTVLRKVTDGATEIVRGLDAAGQTNRDCWIIHFILAKIDAETRRKWIAISTIFEWVITSIVTTDCSPTTTMHTAIDIYESLRRFWELEDVNQEFHGKPEDDEVEQHFVKTHTRDSKGRYIVELPFKTSMEQFSDTLQGALTRFRGVERRLKKDPILHSQYVQFMREYLQLGHMRELSAEDIDKKPGFYLPHHPVITQKLRVVFDGPFKDTNGRSLNEALHIGPSILRNLFSICMRFRIFKFVFSADIVKMYRQIWVAANHCGYQRIVWREDETTPIKHYELSTVTYGTSCAPFLAVRVLDQLAHDHQHDFPTAAKILKEQFYVDDVLTGAHTEDELIRNQNELIQLMKCAGMELGKWVSNSSLVADRSLATTGVQGKGSNSTAKVLGVHWDPEEDMLSYKVCLTTNPHNTKRQVLSDVARIFDPLCILSPVVVQFKILFQELWLLDLGWDTEFPPKIADWWNKCHASIKAYSAVIYSRVMRADGTVSVSLIAGKTRVAPLKQQSLPRLELCGALLLSRLFLSVKAALQHNDIEVHAWCDSTIVLAWLSHPPTKLKTFVANRTSEILEALPRNAWHHVNTKENPADCATRGMLASDLLHFDLWWMGPSWLQDPEMLAVKLTSKKFCSSLLENHGKEEVKTTALTAQETSSLSPIEALTQRVSSWTKLVRVVAYALRFIQKTKATKSATLANGKMLTFEEIQAARILCLQEAQKCFIEDRKLLTENEPLHSRSQLVKLSPIICKDGLLRVGGRLDNSQLPADVKHPILLPKSNRITRMILEHEHTTNLHPGVSALFVIVRGVGKEKARKTKGYICLFVCLVTSAIHLELATDLSTDTFLACLRRFMSLRGKCSQIFSDNGTNFVSAKRALDEMQQLLSSQEHQRNLAQSLADDGIKWSFIPPHSPHWGGKSVHTPDTDLTYLSPAHFLIGRSFTTVPEGDLTNLPINRLDYWQHLQSMYQGFWERWHQEYLTSLQQRQKWSNKERNIAVDNIVLVKDSNLPPAAWILARVVEAHPGPDGLVSAVKLKRDDPTHHQVSCTA